MIRWFSFAVAAASVAALVRVPPASAADAPAMRSLTFNVDVTTRMEQRRHTSGLTVSQDTTPAGGTGIVSQNASSAGKGSIIVDVIAVTADGLVVDIAENVEGRGAPKTRVGITTKGRLVYDAVKSPVNEEEMLLLQLLNRALVEGHDADGASWSDELTDRGLNDVTHYRVVSSTEVTPGPVLHLDVERSVSVAGVHGFDLTEAGKVDYNEQRAVPLDVTLRVRRTNTEAMGVLVQQDSVYTYKLAADSGVRRPTGRSG